MVRNMARQLARAMGSFFKDCGMPLVRRSILEVLRAARRVLTERMLTY
jgi:hypothetical protein